MRRLTRRFERDGDGAAIHGLRGRRSKPGSFAGGARAGSGAGGGAAGDDSGRADASGAVAAQAQAGEATEPAASAHGAGRAGAVGQLGPSVDRGPGAGRPCAGGAARRRDVPDAAWALRRARHGRGEPARDHRVPRAPRPPAGGLRRPLRALRPAGSAARPTVAARRRSASRAARRTPAPPLRGSARSRSSSAPYRSAGATAKPLVPARDPALFQEPFAPSSVATPGHAHLLDLPVLRRAERPLDSSLRLRRARQRIRSTPSFSRRRAMTDFVCSPSPVRSRRAVLRPPSRWAPSVLRRGPLLRPRLGCLFGFQRA